MDKADWVGAKKKDDASGEEGGTRMRFFDSPDQEAYEILPQPGYVYVFIYVCSLTGDTSL